MKHTDCVSAKTLQHPTLCRRFVGRSDLDEVDSLAHKVKAKVGGCATGDRAKFAVIWCRNVKEPRPKSITHQDKSVNEGTNGGWVDMKPWMLSDR